MAQPFDLDHALKSLAWYPKYVYGALTTPGYGSFDFLKDLMAKETPIPTFKGSQRHEANDLYNYREWFVDKCYPNRSIHQLVQFRYMPGGIWNPFSDLFSVNMSMSISPCFKKEVKFLECIEYYGMKKGMEVCRNYWDDFQECGAKNVQELRIEAMRRERNKRWLEWLYGKREWDTVYIDMPKPHAYNEPFVNYRDAI